MTTNGTGRTRTSDGPTIAELTELTRRLRTLSAAGPDADPAERAAFLVDKAALLHRIHAAASDAHDGDDEPDGAGTSR